MYKSFLPPLFLTADPLMPGLTVPPVDGVLVNRLGPNLDLNFTNSPALDPRITFTRSDIAPNASYFDSSGVMRFAAPNLLLRSSDFTQAAWTKFRCSTAIGATSPDGGTTGSTLTEDGTTNSHPVVQTLTGSIVSATAYTLSAYVQPTGRVQVTLALGNTGFVAGVTATFGLSGAGSIASSANCTASIQAAGSFYRVSITATSVGSGNADCYVQPSVGGATSYPGSSASALVLWGAQLEQGSAATAYIPTSATASGAPRIDTNPITLAPRGLLVEEARTNSVRNSTCQGVTPGTPGSGPTNWGPSAAGALAYTTVATGTEFGMAYVDYRVFGTTSGAAAFGCLFDSTTGVAGVQNQVWSASCYMRLIAGSFGVATPTLYIQEYTNVGAFLTNGGTGYTVTSALTKLTHTRTLTSATCAFIAPSSYFFYPSAGIVVDFTVRQYAPQVELGGFPTSYIPTSTIAVTRAADLVSMPSASFYSNPSGFALAIGATHAALPTTTAVMLELDNGTTAQRTILYGSGGAPLVLGNNNGLSSPMGSIVSATPFKVAATLSATSTQYSSLNGATPVSAAATALPTGITTLFIGQPADNSQRWSGWIARVRYWNRSLSPFELRQASS